MRSATLFCITLLLAAFVGTASAQRPDTTSREASPSEAQPKDPDRALLYSMGGTILLAPVFGAGLIVGPSFGHFYADNSAQAWIGIGTRGGAALIAFLGTYVAFGAGLQGQSGLASVGGGLLIVGVGVVVVSAIYDIVDADNSARQYNRAHGLQTSGVRIRAAPTVGGPRGQQIGLALRAQF